MRVRVRVTGRVQGVGFRYHTCEQARGRALTGWVRNAADGSVEAEFQGADDAVNDMVAWCRRGPRTARVDSVTPMPCEERASESGFRSLG